MKLNEAKDLGLYRALLTIIGSYVDKYPVSALDDLFDKILTLGLKILPIDAHAQQILDWILITNSVPAAVQKLQNMRFAGLPYDLKPMYRDGKKHLLAFWKQGDALTDRIIGLLNINEDKAGYWCDQNGDKVDLIMLARENKESEDVNKEVALAARIKRWIGSSSRISSPDEVELQREFEKEKKEHPTFTDDQIWQIIKDHWKSEDVTDVSGTHRRGDFSHLRHFSS